MPTPTTPRADALAALAYKALQDKGLTTSLRNIMLAVADTAAATDTPDIAVEAAEKLIREHRPAADSFAEL